MDPNLAYALVEAQNRFGQLLDMGVIDDQLTIQMARVIGSSLARVASACAARTWPMICGQEPSCSSRENPLSRWN